MRLLLDTHVVYWWFTGQREEFSGNLQELLTHSLEVFISPVTPWELLVKQSKGKLELPEGMIDDMCGDEFRELPLRHRHTMTAGRLPGIHRDPFDRLLVAQAQCDAMTLVTRDSIIPKYEVDVLPA